MEHYKQISVFSAAFKAAIIKQLEEGSILQYKCNVLIKLFGQGYSGVI